MQMMLRRPIQLYKAASAIDNILQEVSLRTWDAGSAELIAKVTRDALTYAVHALGMRYVIAAQAAARRHRTVATNQLRWRK